jgi:hypothetical protein
MVEVIKSLRIVCVSLCSACSFSYGYPEVTANCPRYSGNINNVALDISNPFTYAVSPTRPHCTRVASNRMCTQVVIIVFSLLTWSGAVGCVQLPTAAGLPRRDGRPVQ